MDILKQLYLGEEGIKYLQSYLNSAGKGLCAKLLTLPLLSAGMTYALVPEKTEIDRAKEFKVGGLMKMSHMREWLAQHVTSLNSTSHGGMLILQDAWGASPKDAYIEKIKTPVFYDENDVYYVLQNNEINHDSLIQAIKEPGYLFVGAFITPSINIIGQTINDNALYQLALNVQEIFVGAYDQEGLVIWKKNANGFGTA